jgi:hypothetical protein
MSHPVYEIVHVKWALRVPISSCQIVDVTDLYMYHKIVTETGLMISINL